MYQLCSRLFIPARERAGADAVISRSSIAKVRRANCFARSRFPNRSLLKSSDQGRNADRSVAVGGAEEIRTPDLRLAKAALSQLSYGPFMEGLPQRSRERVNHFANWLKRLDGGPFWTRTRDLSLIRTAL